MLINRLIYKLKDKISVCSGFIRKREWVLVVFLILVYFLHRLLSYKLGIYMEECRDANAHLMILNGKVPYRDFSFWFYGPFAFCIYPLAFKIFGISLVVFRLSYIVIASLVIPLVYYLARRLMPISWSGLAAFLSTILIDVPYYTYNHILASVAGLFALLFIVKFVETNSVNLFFLVGIFIGVTLLVKPFIMGLGTLLAVVLFITIFNYEKRSSLKTLLWYFALIILGIVFIIAPFIIYFSVNRTLYSFFALTTPWAVDRASAFYTYGSFQIVLSQHLEYLKTILPYRIFFCPGDWKTILVQSYDRLILFSPIIFPLGIILFNKLIFKKYHLMSSHGVRYFLLFTLFSIFISIQSLLCLQQMGRSFTSQVPFILLTYFLFLINKKNIYRSNLLFRYTMLFLTCSFIFYLVFLHFFRYPYSRFKKYVVPLEIERAQGIKVTYPEKQLYEMLDKYLAKNMKKDDTIAVFGYYPQFSFLTGKENIFGDVEDFYTKLNYLSGSPLKSDGDKDEIEKFEQYLINRIKSKNPRYILVPIRLGEKRFPTEVNAFIEKEYILQGTLGPAEIDIYTPGVVKVYNRNNKR